MRTLLSGIKLQSALRASGLTQTELARRLGTTRQNVNIWCREGTRGVSVDLLNKLRDHLGCTDDDLLVVVNDPAPRKRWGASGRAAL